MVSFDKSYRETILSSLLSPDCTETVALWEAVTLLTFSETFVRLCNERDAIDESQFDFSQIYDTAWLRKLSPDKALIVRVATVETMNYVLRAIAQSSDTELDTLLKGTRDASIIKERARKLVAEATAKRQ